MPLLRGDFAVVQTNDSPLAVNLLEYVSFECPSRSDFTINAARFVIDEAGDYCDVATWH